jgi:Zn-dependent M28 family amino/carboxypeptidase
LLVVLGLVGLLTALAVPAPAFAVDDINTKKIRNAVTVGGILSHERALQRIANQNGGTRASGTPGYAASAEYVKGVLTRAGYQVSEQEFTFPFFRDLAEPELAQVSPTPATYETATFQYSGSGDVTGTVVAAGGTLVPAPETPGSASGCAPGDFTPASASEPQVALVQRGTCNFSVKAANAQAAGYDAVIIFNEGQPGRTDIDASFPGTLGAPFTIPVVGLSYADGSALFTQLSSGPVTVRVVTSTETDLNARTTNIIADSPGGDPNKVLVVGAHLDSVVEGPGINDNGSGTSTILEIAEEMAELGVDPRQKVRFAFWGAEEEGLLGSTHYVDQLDDVQLGTIFANLNFDMLGSPNYVRFVYDGNGSDTPESGPPGSAQIEEVFTKYFAGQGLATEPTAFDGRSDYGPFIAAGIPAGGLFSGAEGVKTPEQAATYGGTAGAPYDPCYHQACDDIKNLSTKALAELGDGAAHAVFTLARTKSGFFEDGSLRVQARRAAPDFDYKGTHSVR